MHITHALAQVLPGRWRSAVATLGVAFCSTIVLAIAGLALAGTAQALAETHGPYNIRAAHSDKCMDVRAAGSADGDPVQQWRCLGAGQTNQQWFLTDTGDGLTFYVTARHSGKCLDVRAGELGNGTPLQQWQCLGYAQSNQRWYLTRGPVGSTFNLRAAHSNSCVDVTAGGFGDGVLLQQWACLGFAQSNQRWYLTSP
jgi:glucosylceramidase